MTEAQKQPPNKQHNVAIGQQDLYFWLSAYFEALDGKQYQKALDILKWLAEVQGAYRKPDPRLMITVNNSPY